MRLFLTAALFAAVSSSALGADYAIQAGQLLDGTGDAARKAVTVLVKDGRIEATAQSFWFGRTSDIVIRVRRAGSIGARTDARAESREGTIDHGFNIFLLRDFKAKAGI